ncbi:AIPR family protein [Coleofasciculus sp. FACHB-501]|uniref:AIPR family protein n=1 Tax=Cyanophyceae TaxID=3028117 RepID=UPI001684DA45|nr:AIPR family protein [Coleofasciculus sp. FACHB-501]MBD1836942.1 AIPR family protein [Coleofasciculus sp. FACHB-501]
MRKVYTTSAKKNQYADKDKNLRLDAEKSGQVIMAFYKEMPREAKNRKKFIFGERYDEIFSDEITADKVLLPYKLFERIEEEKTNLKKDLSSSEDNFVLYSSYYILYIIANLAQKSSISLEFSKIDEIWELYPQVIEILKKVIEIEQRNLGHKDKFSYAAFFNTDKPKKIFEQHSW